MNEQCRCNQSNNCRSAITCRINSPQPPFASSNKETQLLSFFFFSFSLFSSHSQRRLRQKVEKKIAETRGGQAGSRDSATLPLNQNFQVVNFNWLLLFVSPPFPPPQEKDEGNASPMGMGEKILAIGRVSLFFFPFLSFSFFQLVAKSINPLDNFFSISIQFHPRSINSSLAESSRDLGAFSRRWRLHKATPTLFCFVST